MNKVKHVVMRNEKQVFMQWQYMVSIYGLTYLKNIWDIKLLKVLLQGFMELNKKRRHTLICYILVLYCEACNAWNIVIKSWLQSKTSTSWRKDRNGCSCVIWWFLNMACQVEVCFVQRIKSSLLQCKTKKWRYKNEIWNSLLMCKV